MLAFNQLLWNLTIQLHNFKIPLNIINWSMFCNWIYKKLWFDFYPLFWFKWFVFDEHSTWKWLNMSALKIDYRIIYALKCNHETNDKLYNVRTWFEWLLSDLKTKKNIHQHSFVMVLKFKRIFDHRQMFDVICMHTLSFARKQNSFVLRCEKNNNNHN